MKPIILSIYRDQFYKTKRNVHRLIDIHVVNRIANAFQPVIKRSETVIATAAGII